MRIGYDHPSFKSDRKVGSLVNVGYEPPSVRDIGTLVQLTEQQFNKIGHTPDVYTTITNNQVIGSLVPVQ